MEPRAELGNFERVVLTAIVDLGENAYGVTIQRRTSDLYQPRSVSLGAVYATLDRLEDKGLVASWLSEPTAERGGRSRRHYRLEETGISALKQSLLVDARIRDCVEGMWGPIIPTGGIA